MPTDRPYDFSKELFPRLLEKGKPMYGYVTDGYWQDIGNLDQYRQGELRRARRQGPPGRPGDPPARERVGGGGGRARRPRVGQRPGVHRQLLPHPPGRDRRPVHGARRRASRSASARERPVRSSTRGPTSRRARASRARSSGGCATSGPTRASRRAPRSVTRRRSGTRRSSRPACGSTRSRRSSRARRSTTTSSGRVSQPRRSSPASGSAACRTSISRPRPPCAWASRSAPP